MSARDEIFAAIRAGRARRGIAETPATELAKRLQAPEEAPAPAGTAAERLAMFTERARREAGSVDCVSGAEQAPHAIARYLRDNGLEPRIVLAPDPALAGMAWSAAGLERAEAALAEDGQTVVTGCYAAVAEIGAVVTASSAEHPAEYNFLPATHVVVARVEQIVGRLEEVWARLRADYAGGLPPRALATILGPSRSADIELTLEFGAHGPVRTHVVIVGVADPAVA